MPRPTILVAEPEPEQALSVRKLVLEAAKFNVITAHSSREARDLFHLFPNISAAILVGDSEIDCERVAKEIKVTTDKVPVVYIYLSVAGKCTHADHNMAGGQPEELLQLMQNLLGDPRTSGQDGVKRRA